MPTNTSDRSVHVSRDAIGNTIITGDKNTVVVYQIRSSVAFEEESEQTVGLAQNPYCGLEAFDENDSDRFFGRERETSDLWEALYRLDANTGGDTSVGRIIPIIGASGSGKSSLARAGLIAELARRPWPGRSPSSVAIMVPGERPLESLAAAMLRVRSKQVANIEEIRELSAQLSKSNEQGEFDGLRLICRMTADSSQSMVLLIDQFEETFSICSDEAKRNAFIENLRLAAIDAGGSVRLVLTLRTDFLPQLQHIDWLNRAITYNGYIVPKMEEPALRTAISEPARRAGYTLDTGIVDLLIAQTRGRDGALPLLQFALSQIWQGLTQSPLVVPADTLRNIGGIGGALAKEAQRQFDFLPEPDRAIAKRAFIAGVQLNEPGQETRRRFGISEIVAHGQSSDDVLRVLRRFSTRDARLLTLFISLQNPETQIEITHETLISQWPTLTDWVRKTRDDILFHRRMAEAAKAWSMKTGGIWRSPELDRLREYYQRARSDFTTREIDFYEASERQVRWETLAKRAAVAALIAAVVVTSVLAIWALQQRKQAQQELVVAHAHQLAAESSAVLARYPERSLLLALEAERLGTDTASPEQSLRDALKGLAGYGLGRTAAITEAFLAANQQWLVIQTEGGKIYVRPMGAEPNQATAIHFLGYGHEYGDLDSSSDHRWVITGEGQDSLTLWDLNSKVFPSSFKIDSGAHAFTPDSHWFVEAYSLGQLRLWPLQPSFINTPIVVPLEAPATKVAASKSTAIAVLANGDACEVKLSTPASGCRRIVLEGASALERIDLSPDGRILVGALHTSDNWRGGSRVAAWFIQPSAAATRTATLLGDVARTELVTMSHNSQWVALTNGTDLNTGNGGLITLCRLQQASASCYSLDEHRGEVNHILFSPDDKVLTSTGWDSTTRIWNLQAPDPSKFPVVLRGHTGQVNTAVFDLTGQWLATGGADQNVIRWDMKARDVAASGTVFSGTEGEVSSVFFSNDGLRLFAGSKDGALHYWDLKRTLPSADPDVLPVQLGHADVGTGITFTHDMRWAFTYEGDDGESFTLRRVTPDKRADDPIRIPFTLKGYMLDAGFSDNSRWLAISDQNTNITKLYDLSTDDPLHHEHDLTGVFPGFRRQSAFSPDQKWLITFDSAAKHMDAWDLTSIDPIKHELAVGDVSLGELYFSADGQWLACQEKASLHAIDLKSHDLADHLVAQDASSNSSAIWFTPGNKSIAYLSERASIVIADPAGKSGPIVGPYVGGNASVEPSPDKTRLLTKSDPAVEGIQSLNDQLNRRIASLRGAKSPIRLTLWKWTGKQYESLPSSTTVEGDMHLSEFSPDSHWLLTATDHDTNPTLWNLDSDNPFSNPITLWGHTIRDNHYWLVGFTSDERWLATATDADSSVRLWDLRNPHIERSVVSLGGLGGGASQVLFSSDNKQLLGLGGGGLRMWRMTDKGVSDVAFNLGALSKNGEAFEGVMFSPANDELVGWGGGEVRFWSLHFADLARKAEAAAGRNFTWEEWAQTFPRRDYSKIFPNIPVDASVVSGELDQAHLQLLKGNIQKAREFYENADKWSDEIGDPAVSNDVAWKGATDDMAQQVASAAEAAVKMDPGNGWYRDTRALVRALTGDTEGAIEDYEAYLEWARYQKYEYQSTVERRRAWLSALKSGSNPFNEKLLRLLRDE
jgi:WD40 repeat protein